MIGIPFTVLFLSLAYNWLRSDDRQSGVSTAGKSIEAGKQNSGDEPEATASTPDHRSTGIGFASSSLSAVASSSRPIITPSAYRLVSSAPVAFFLRWLALPFVLGALAVINTWDLPTYLGLMVATFLLGRYRRHHGISNWGQAGRLLLRGGLFAGALLATTYLLYAPFFINYQALDVGLGLVHTKTALDQHLKIWGFFLFILVPWLWVSLLHPATRNSLLRALSLILRRWNVWPHFSQVYRNLVSRPSEGYQLGLWSGLAVLFIAAALALLGYRVPAYLLPLVLLALALLFRWEVTAETAYLTLLTFTGLLVLLGVEFFFLRDFLGGGEYYRMNPLFKFFIQVWIMFGLVAAVILPRLWHLAWQWPLSSQLIWQGGVLILLLASLIYPVLGTRTRIDDRFPGDDNRPAIGTLDGLAYMTVGEFEFEWPYGSRTFNRIDLQYDYEAIRWLQNNVQGTPVIAEAKVGYYREGGMRVAAYTGLPSVLGGLHQNEQHPPSQISARDLVFNEFWTTPDPARTLELIEDLDISYIYVGQLERIIYGDQTVDKFEQLRAQGELELVFENEKTRIYKRIAPPDIG